VDTYVRHKLVHTQDQTVRFLPQCRRSAMRRVPVLGARPDLPRKPPFVQR